ncbi:MAG: SUMF1/EgtB/PvdO family nonheme iron enzyme, partial [Thermoleophilia bacterium]|nr:SUMF1/EgtB/PvdO family nonheme iron enzyme [Thermoleophilia bacterium]
LYNPFKQPRAGRGALPLPRGDDCFEYMRQVRERVRERAGEIDPYIAELVIQHELQHNETMLQLLRMMDDYAPPAALDRAAPERAARDRTGLDRATRTTVRERHDKFEWIEFPAGDYRVGSNAAPGEFVYDNEQCEHEVDLAAFAIASRPVLNGEFREWVEAGGYDSLDHWSPDGRRWLAEEAVSAPLGWLREGGEVYECGFGERRPLDERAPVIHVSWFEADAFARAAGARLPSEPEWEVAASYDPAAGAAGPCRRHPWGDDDWRPGLANLDQLAWGTLPAGASDPGNGCVDMAGQVWEWTASEFSAYPGFQPFCYAEYSAPFFDGGYRVLRGGSWATRARSVDNRFRNWDHPQRRQIFAGFRLARDV